MDPGCVLGVSRERGAAEAHEGGRMESTGAWHRARNRLTRGAGYLLVRLVYRVGRWPAFGFSPGGARPVPTCVSVGSSGLDLPLPLGGRAHRSSPEPAAPGVPVPAIQVSLATVRSVSSY
jgi:hypothetical protein